MSMKFNPAGVISIGKNIVVILALAVLGLVVYKNAARKASEYTFKPTEVQITYLPAAFSIQLDEEDALAILSHPERNRRAFDNLVLRINTSILDHVSNRMGLDKKTRAEVRNAYDRQHPYLREMYYNDFVALKDTSSNLQQIWYDNESRTSVEVLYEIASRYTCFIVNHVISTVVPTQQGVFLARGQKLDTPCGIAMTEALNPVIRRMEERAAIRDFGRSKGILQEKVEKAIGELATMELRDKKGISKQMKTKLWGFKVSTTDVDISALSIIKVGFNLKGTLNLEVDSRSSTVVVSLPQPVILSHEIHPKVEKLDIGWLREVQGSDLNQNIDLLRAEFRREALQSDIMDKSRNQARELLETLLGPIVQSLGSRYKLEVRFVGLKSS